MEKNINILLKRFSNIDKKILKIMKIGLKFSFYFCILATLILFTYNFLYLPALFYTGISLLQSGLFFIVAFTICGFAFDKIIHDIG
jgi:hypothetical protein